MSVGQACAGLKRASWGARNHSFQNLKTLKVLKIILPLLFCREGSQEEQVTVDLGAVAKPGGHGISPLLSGSSS